MSCRLLFIALFGALMLPFAQTASAASARAELSSNQTRVGQPVELRLVFEGSGEIEINDNIDIASLGLSVLNQGTSQNYSFHNGRQTNSTIHTVVIRPEREGDITIPSLSVSIGGKSLRTNPVTLKVMGAARPGTPNPGLAAPRPAQPVKPGQAQPQSVAPDEDEDPQRRFGYIELLVPKASAYEGEMIPAEIRLYLSTNYRYRPQAPPEISGKGFTVQKLTNPDQSIQPINGRQFHVITYKTAISATKPGKITIGPAQANWSAFVPTQRRRSRFGNDPFADMDDLLGQFNMGGMEEVSLQLKSDPVELEVKALPKEGRPADFGGAVGEFAMSTVVKPEKAAAGEPITMTSRITGTGNFDRVTAPVLEDSPEWRSYSPSAKFEAEDAVGLSGTKVFESVITAKSAQKVTPNATFSYFDPSTEKYVTLESGPLAVQIAGQAAVVQSATPAATPGPSSSATPAAEMTAQPTATSTDILFIRSDLGTSDGTFLPVWKRSAFITTQYVAGSTLFLTILGFALAARSRNQTRKNAAALAKDLSITMAKLRGDITAGNFYVDAVHYLSLAAISAGAAGHPDSAEDIRAARFVSEEVQSEIEEIFRQRNDLRYGRAGDSPIDEGVKKRVLSALEAYQKAPRAEVASSSPAASGFVAAFLLGALVFLNPQESKAQTTEQRFEQANRAYEAGKYQDAVTDYEYLAQTGVNSPNLYYNLGDSWYRLKESGKAILNYERALALDPSHPEALANLRFVRKQEGSVTVEPSWWLANIEAVGVNRLPWLACATFWLGAFLVVFAIFRLAGQRGVWVTFGALSLVASLLFAGGLWSYIEHNGVSDAGVVVAPKVKGRVAPTETANETGSIPVGTRVRMLSDRGSWIYVEMPDGKTRGWVPEGAVEAIRPKTGKSAGA